MQCRIAAVVLNGHQQAFRRTSHSIMIRDAASNRDGPDPRNTADSSGMRTDGRRVLDTGYRVGWVPTSSVRTGVLPPFMYKSGTHSR
jgi:hypothetical protein